MQKEKRINKIGVIIGISLLLINRLLWWGILPSESLPDRGIFAIIALVFLHFSVFSVVGYKRIASETFSTQFSFKNIWTLLIMGILAIIAFGTIFIFAPDLVQSWLRSK